MCLGINLQLWYTSFTAYVKYVDGPAQAAFEGYIEAYGASDYYGDTIADGFQDLVLGDDTVLFTAITYAANEGDGVTAVINQGTGEVVDCDYIETYEYIQCKCPSGGRSRDCKCPKPRRRNCQAYRINKDVKELCEESKATFREEAFIDGDGSIYAEADTIVEVGLSATFLLIGKSNPTTKYYGLQSHAHSNIVGYILS